MPRAAALANVPLPIFGRPAPAGIGRAEGCGNSVFPMLVKSAGLVLLVSAVLAAMANVMEGKVASVQACARRNFEIHHMKNIYFSSCSDFNVDNLRNVREKRSGGAKSFKHPGANTRSTLSG